MRKIAILIFLASCSFQPKPSVVTDRAPLALSNPAPLTLSYPEIGIVRVGGESMMCLTVEGYRQMSDNMLKMQNFMKEQKFLIETYRKYYEGVDAK